MSTNEFQPAAAGNSSGLRAKLMVAASFWVMLFGLGAQSIFGIFFAPTLNEFGWTRATLSGAFSLAWIISGVMGIVMGMLCDRYGSRGILTASGVLLGAGFALMHQLNSIWQFYLFYGVIIGVGLSGIWVPIMSTIARNFVEKRALVTAVAMTGSGIASFAAPPVSNWLISLYDWRTAYLILGIVTFIVVTIGAQFMRPLQVNARPKGASSQAGPVQSAGISLKDSLVTVRFWAMALLVFCLGFCAYTVIVHIAPQAIFLGIDSSTAAYILAVSGGSAIVSRLLMGSVSRRTSNRFVFILGFSLIALSFLGFVYAREVWALFLLSAVFGFGFGAGVVISPFVAELFGLKSHGVILGIIVLGYSIGSAVGPIAAGSIFDFNHSYQAAFAVSAAIAVLGLVLTLIIRPPRPLVTAKPG